MSKIEKDELTCTAYHEAGHAVVAYLLGRRLKRVSIVPNSDAETLGHCQRVPHRNFHPDRIGTKFDGRMVDEMVASIAGPMAEEKFSGRRHTQGAQKDYQMAEDLVAYVTPSFEEGRDFYKWVRGRTKRMLDTRWPQVTAVAEALLEKQELAGDKVLKVIGEVRRADAIGENKKEGTKE